MELASGSILCSRYLLEDRIGRGGTSIIFRARDLHLTIPHDPAAEFVAIKVLRAELRTEPSALERLQREFQQMRCLSHPGIVRVFDLHCDGHVWFMSMELIAGVTVKTWLAMPGSHANALQIIGDCCEALEYAHSLGILHGDIKATNVMVSDAGTAKLVDFGSAPSRDNPGAAGPDSALAATRLFASPQILAGRSADPRDDVYSLACLSYGILSGGRHPYGGHPSLEDGRVKSAPTYVRSIPPELFEVLKCGLSAERERRPATVKQFRRELTDAYQRHRAAETSAATTSGDAVRVVTPPEPLEHAVDSAPRSTIIVPSALVTMVDRLRVVRDFHRRGRRFVWPIALVIALVGIAALFRLGMHREAIPSAMGPATTPASTPEQVASTDIRPHILPETKPLLHDTGGISFETSTVNASAMQPLVAISVKRTRASGTRGTFGWRVQQGSALPGVDYERMGPQVVRFIEGQRARILYIPLIRTPATSTQRGPRVFTVVLGQVAGGPALGPVARVTVAINPPPTAGSFTLYQARAEEQQTR
jgi:serine/threonine protein kinase